MPGGRPTKYRPEMCDQVDDYLIECQGVEANKDEDVQGIDTKLPTRAGFAIYLKVSKRVTADWETKHPEFLQALSKIETVQNEQLIQFSLTGKYNHSISKLMLSANHGMHEKQKTEHSGQVQLGAPIINMPKEQHDKT